MTRSASLLFALAALSTHASAAGSDVQSEAEALLCLSRSSLLRLELPAGADAPFAVELELDGAPEIMELRPHSIRSGSFRLLEHGADGEYRELDPGPVRTLRGELVGDPGSWVAASLLDDGLWARIQTSAGEDLWIEPLVGRVRGAGFGTHVLYRGVDSQCGGGWCGTVDFPGDESLPDDELELAGKSLWVTEIGVDCDYPFHNTWGGTSGASARVATVLNTMNAEYEDEVNITHLITTVIVRSSSASDPYEGTSPDGLLLQFKSEWATNQTGVQRDVAQLFTGRNLDGSVIGIAYPGGICTNFGYNLVQNYGNLGCATDLSAHELGHTWNATHCSCNGYTMNPFITCGNTFTAATRKKVINFRKTRDCLDLDFDGSELFYDGFESGDLAAGGWTTKNLKSRAATQADYTGQYGLNIKRQSWAAKAISTAGSSAVQVEFAYRVRQYESGEGLYPEWSGDGGVTWNLIATLTSSSWVDRVSFALPSGAANNPSFVLRIRGGGVGKNLSTGKNKKAHVDDVRIIVE